MDITHTIAKNGAIFYYKIKDNKKVRISEKDVPKEYKEKVSEPKAIISKPKKEGTSKLKATVSKPKKESTSKPNKEKVSKPKKVSLSKPKKVSLSKPKKENVSNPKIRIGQHQRAKAHPSYEGFEKITAWSRGDKKWKSLSPFFIQGGKFIDIDGEIQNIGIFENFWQSFKVWNKVYKQNKKEWTWPNESHIGPDGNPNEKWMKWHETLLNHDQAVRRPNGKEIPKYAWWRDQKTGKLEKLDIVQARKKIYIPFLKKLYRKSESYKRLLEKFKSGQNLMIIEPDGPLLELYPNGLEVNLELLNEMIDKTNYKNEGMKNKYFPYGHGYVIAMCLLEDY